MLVSFNRQSGYIVELGQSLDNYNHKTMKISDVQLTKYKEIINQDSFIDKKDIYGNILYKFQNTETSLLKVTQTDIAKGSKVYDKDNIIIYDISSYSEVALSKQKVPKKESLYYIFPQNYKFFTIDEVMNEHYKTLLENSDSEYIIADNFSDLRNILINDSQFKSINKREIILGKGHELKLKSLELLSLANTFKILSLSRGITLKINDRIVEGSISLPTPINRINISFINETDRPLVLDTYAIGYSMVDEEGGIVDATY